MLADDDKLAEFDREGEVDFAYSVEGLARFRVNAFRQRGAVSIVAPRDPLRCGPSTSSACPPVMGEIADEERGLILLTGTTGLRQVDDARGDHRLDQRDQVAPHRHDRGSDRVPAHRRNSIINQREVGMDTATFGRAMRRVLRQDPDVILIGEMRDEETVRTALSAAETGHLVLSTVHTIDAPETVNRIIDFFPPHEQSRRARCWPAR